MTELLELQSVWEDQDVFYITYHNERGMPERAYTFGNLTERPLRVIPMFFKVLAILRRERPDWVISDGAEIAIPVFVASKLLGLKTMFIESFCRVHTPSFTGRVVYPIADVFFVQWPTLLEAYGSKARYEGAVL